VRIIFLAQPLDKNRVPIGVHKEFDEGFHILLHTGVHLRFKPCMNYEDIVGV